MHTASMSRLLVVEDDLAMANALSVGLSAEGFEVVVAVDGIRGVEAAEEGHFDAIVLDLMLPGLSGYRVCQLLRQRGDSTPVLVLTAKQGEWDEAEALDTGADDFLKKPFSFVVLVAHIRAVLRRRSGRGAEVLSAGDLKVDPLSHRCWRGDVEIDLTPREFAVLELLLARVGQPVAKREILDEVWDWAIDEHSNLVEVYIGYLRRKIDAPFARQAIQTVRAVGYRVDPAGG